MTIPAAAGANQMQLSIIVPVYNIADYLQECLVGIVASARTAPADSWQMICVDDGSADGSSALLDAFAQAHSMVCVIHQENAGVSTARNVGIDAAQGRYIAFVDGDDYVEDSFVDRLVSWCKTDNADIVVFGGRPDDETVRWMRKGLTSENEVLEGPDAGIDCLAGRTAATPFVFNKLYRTQLLHDNNLAFDPSFALGEDNVFLYQIFPLAGRIILHDDTLYVHRVERSDSAMDDLWQNRLEALQTHVRMVDTIATAWERYGIWDARHRALLLTSLRLLFYTAPQLPYAQYVRFSEYFTDMFSRRFQSTDLESIKPHYASMYRMFLPGQNQSRIRVFADKLRFRIRPDVNDGTS